jgi:uncharacterized protein (DUF1330 family)
MVMSYELVVALQVDDDKIYSQYRAQIGPMLESAGGSFRYDFEIARTLQNSAEHGINRVFVLAFPDARAKELFFADPRYREIRRRLFDRAVNGTTIIAEYDR